MAASSKTRAGFTRRTSLSAVRPSGAVVTSSPCASRMAFRSSRLAASSSATKTLLVITPHLSLSVFGGLQYVGGVLNLHPFHLVGLLINRVPRTASSRNGLLPEMEYSPSKGTQQRPKM